VVLTELEIARRREVWIAQSDLFLDTDVRLSFAYVARVCAASEFDRDQLESIFRDEVAPIVESNLLDIAGDWAGFPEDWLVSSIVARLETDGAGNYRLRTSVLDEWRAVNHLVTRLRGLPPEQRDSRWRLWNTLSKLFLEREPNPPDAWHAGYTSEQLAWIFQEEMLPSYGKSIEAYRTHAPKMYPTRGELVAAWAKWLEPLR